MRLLVVVLAVLLLASCREEVGTPRAGSAATSTTTTTTEPEPERTGTLLIAGDIGVCTRPDDEATSDVVLGVLKEHPDAVVAAAGDLAYDRGSEKEYRDCYAPSWGRFKDKTRPAPGNHEYATANAAGYFGYWGAAAGEKGKGWYSYDVGPWHVVAVNSNCAQVGGCGPGSEQGRWLAADLAAHRSACTLAYWHHPRFSSGYHGTDLSLEPLWRLAVDGGVDVVVSGHDHHYERFAPVDGAREFVVGTGGAPRYPVVTAEAGSEVRHSGTPGVLQLTFRAKSYEWKFLRAAGGDFADAGASPCT